MKTVLLMARDYHTPIDVWLSLTLVEFKQWTNAATEVVKDLKKSRKE